MMEKNSLKSIWMIYKLKFHADALKEWRKLSAADQWSVVHVVQLVGDACATFDRIGPNGVKYDAQLIHEVCLSDLNGEFCQVVDTSKLYI